MVYDLADHRVDLLGADNLMWASDYPHFDCIFPGAVKELKEHMGGISEEARRKMLGESAARLYNDSYGRYLSG